MSICLYVYENYYVLSEFTLHRDTYKFTNLVKNKYVLIRPLNRGVARVLDWGGPERVKRANKGV